MFQHALQISVGCHYKCLFIAAASPGEVACPGVLCGHGILPSCCSTICNAWFAGLSGSAESREKTKEDSMCEAGQAREEYTHYLY